MAFMNHYLAGGTEKISEREAKLASKTHYSDYPNGSEIRRAKMSEFLYDRVAVPRTDKQKNAMPVAELRALLTVWTHELNWLRKKHGLMEDNTKKHGDDDDDND